MFKPNVLIIEDELLIANLTKKYIIGAGYNCVGIAINTQQAQIFLREHKVDFALIDVTLSQGESGIEVAKLINLEYHIPFMYLTSHSDPDTIQKLAETNPVAYLSKPVKKADVITALQLHLNKKESLIPEWFNLAVGKSTYRLRLSQLMYVKSEHVYTRLFFENRDDNLLVRSTLNNLIETLPKNSVIRINRSVAVNTNYIKKRTRQSLEINGKEFKISDSYKGNLDF